MYSICTETLPRPPVELAGPSDGVTDGGPAGHFYTPLQLGHLVYCVYHSPVQTEMFTCSATLASLAPSSPSPRRPYSLLPMDHTLPPDSW